MFTTRAGALALVTLVVSAAAVTACTHKVVTVQKAADDDAGAEPIDDTDAQSTDVDAGSDATPDVDAPPPPETVVVHGSVGQSCDAVCKGADFTCDAVCEFGNSKGKGKLAGQATYSNTKDNFTLYKYEPIAACGDVAPSKIDDFGTIYSPDFSFGSPLSCCCQSPGHYRVEGDAKDPASCREICEAKGHTCDSKTAFGDQFGAGQTQYDCPGSTLLRIVETCDAVPAVSTTSGSKTCTLEKQTCGCI